MRGAGAEAVDLDTFGEAAVRAWHVVKGENLASLENERMKAGMPKRGPAIDAKGVYERRCPACGFGFRTNLESKVYCDTACQDRAYRERNRLKRKPRRLFVRLRP